MFIGKTDGKAEAPILWPPGVETLMLGRIEEQQPGSMDT